MVEEQIQDTRKEIIMFLAITAVLSTIFYVLIITAGGVMEVPLYPLGLMWSPGIAALLTRYIYHKNLRGLGWTWGQTRYQLWAYGLPLGYALIAYGLTWLLGWGKIDPDVASQLGIVQILMLATLGIVSSCISAMGEEIGWRGLLVPQLTKLVGFTKASAISGMIWAVWHYPPILFADYNAGLFSSGDTAPVWYAILCFSIMVISMSFVMNWLRLKSGSVWTAVIFHGVHNAYIQGLFDPLTMDTGFTEYVISEFGVALAVSTAIAGWLFWRKRHTLPESGNGNV